MDGFGPRSTWSERYCDEATKSRSDSHSSTGWMRMVCITHKLKEGNVVYSKSACYPFAFHTIFLPENTVVEVREARTHLLWHCTCTSIRIQALKSTSDRP